MSWKSLVLWLKTSSSESQPGHDLNHLAVLEFSLLTVILCNHILTIYKKDAFISHFSISVGSTFDKRQNLTTVICMEMELHSTYRFGLLTLHGCSNTDTRIKNASDTAYNAESGIGKCRSLCTNSVPTNAPSQKRPVHLNATKQTLYPILTNGK